MGKYIVHSTLRPLGTQVMNRTGGHTFLADEPAAAKGTDAAPNPVQYLLSAVGSCMSVTARDLENKEKNLTIKKFQVDVSGETTSYQDGSSRVTHIDIKIAAETNLSEADHAFFLKEVVRKCTVHESLVGAIPMDITYI
ncbi:OsmC family protein [Secundilactobacillus collinoides]|uniref:OsmC family protein n=2 Tax=Secundilactobacillus collinoides TaxID=33960 RepID=A0A0R2BLB4_SECCO|nr:OsmC family protein [Secundilactobacillus collinoides]KRM76380.1 OsmC family protein [Secundilactobacillus collinoides DSM 20515 = JCM 1123]KZL42974.1 OsmC family protein [Secundilactobacillus collinoides]